MMLPSQHCCCCCCCYSVLSSHRCRERTMKMNHRCINRGTGRTKLFSSFSLIAVMVLSMVLCDYTNNNIYVVFVDSTSTSSTTTPGTTKKGTSSVTHSSNNILLPPTDDDDDDNDDDDPIMIQSIPSWDNFTDDLSTSSSSDDSTSSDEDGNNTNSTTTIITPNGSLPVLGSDIVTTPTVEEEKMSQALGVSTTSDPNNNDTTTIIPDPASLSSTNVVESQTPYWKKDLPYPLNNKTRTLRRLFITGPTPQTKNSVVEVYLLGTAHVSVDSSNDVRLLLQTIDPDIIFVELCNQRAGMLVSPPPSPSSSAGNTTTTTTISSTTTTIWGRLRSGMLFWGGGFRTRQRGRNRRNVSGSSSMFTKATTLLTSLQQDTADSLGVEVGGEFRVAYDYWYDKQRRGRINNNHNTNNRRQQQQQAQAVHLVLGDRLFQCTLLRAWESLRWWGKIRLVVGLLVSSLIKPNPDEITAWMKGILEDDESDLLTKSMEELSKAFPTLTNVIIQERDVYMSCKVYQTCMYMLQNCHHDTPQRYTMVVIVGAGHIEGMCDWLTSPPLDEQQPEEVLSRLVQLKSRPPTEDELAHAMYDVVTVDPQYMEEIAQQMKEMNIEQQQQQQQQDVD